MADEVKHTKGPWTAIGRLIYANGSVDTYSGAVLGVIATCEATFQSDGEGRQWAANGLAEDNAKLIAAAPDLLEALKALQKQALQSELNSPSHEWGMEALALTEAAIARAEGRS